MNKIILSLLLTANAFAFSPYAEVKKEENKVQKDIQQLKIKIQKQEEILEGLTSLNSGISQRLSELERKKDNRPDENVEMIKQLAKMIDDINAQYISKEELTKVVAKLQKQNEAKKVVKEKIIRSDKLYKQAVASYNKKNYKQSKKIFNKLLDRGYKEAVTNFYLGEIEYYSSKYPEALGFYKRSVAISDKGDHMSMLLYHSGYSLEQTKDKKTAVSFYQSIVDGYKGKYVGLAKKRLKALKVI